MIGLCRTLDFVPESAAMLSVEDAANYVAEKFAMQKLPVVRLAQCGQLALYDGSEGPALGLLSLNGREALFVTEQAMRRIPLWQCRGAWRV